MQQRVCASESVYIHMQPGVQAEPAGGELSDLITEDVVFYGVFSERLLAESALTRKLIAAFCVPPVP